MPPGGRDRRSWCRTAPSRAEAGADAESLTQGSSRRSTAALGACARGTQPCAAALERCLLEGGSLDVPSLHPGPRDGKTHSRELQWVYKSS